MTDFGLSKNQSDLLVPILENLTEMILLTRKAFNRQKTSFLNDADKIRSRVEEAIESAKADLQKIQGPSDEKTKAAQLQNILAHVEMIKEKVSELFDPVKKQISGGILFSDKAISQTNFLFDHEAGIFRSFEDILVTGNNILVTYVTGKIDDMHRLCIEFATDHEARLIEGLCQPQAAPIFLAILDCIRNISHHEKEIIRLFHG